MGTAHVVWHESTVSKQQRQQLYRHKSCVLWFTGLSGSGKSTLANAVAERLYRLKVHSYVLDGDNIRHHLNKDLGFSPEDRAENIRRIGEVAKLFVDAGIIVLTAFISPFQADRQLVRKLTEEGEFIEIYVECPLEECEKRDPKGLYQKARRGEIPEFTGITSPYEEPAHPEIVIQSGNSTVDEAVGKIIDYLKRASII
ncbi:adenylyl-sulfate kinase [Ferviditalea candida]|uniref:Adenylyl-sulfate kinase n=1 Tax=Ferviditalea candida TaxID=3108399 RepID=A0ABU5ZH26_9BACL|nr:adenylyl-sulfate kinase [Paenibacillaceae bacterium T2]